MIVFLEGVITSDAVFRVYGGWSPLFMWQWNDPLTKMLPWNFEVQAWLYIHHASFKTELRWHYNVQFNVWILFDSELASLCDTPYSISIPNTAYRKQLLSVVTVTVLQNSFIYAQIRRVTAFTWNIKAWSLVSDVDFILGYTHSGCWSVCVCAVALMCFICTWKSQIKFDTPSLKCNIPGY